MAEYIRIAVDPDITAEITALARTNTHIDDLAPGRAIEWLLGEYKRMKRQVARYEKAASQPAEVVAA